MRSVLLLAAASLAGVLATAASAGTVVPVGHFDSIELRGGGHVSLHYGATASVTLLEGSTDVTHFRIEGGHKLVIDACENNCPHQYDLEIEIVSPTIRGAAIQGGGKIDSASGFPEQDSIAAAIQGGGEIDLRAVAARTATAAVDGGGEIRIHADGRLNAAINGGGSVRYTGAAQVTSEINGGGSVRPE